MPSTTSPLTTRYRMDRATSSAPPSHSETFDHFSWRNVRLPTWMSDMNATRAWPGVPGKGFAVGRSGRGLLSKAPERGGGGGRDDGNGSEVQWRPGPEGLLRDFARMPDVLEGDDEGRLRAGAEESVQFRDRVPLDQEELDRIGFEQRAALAYERQKLLAHPGPHGRQVHKIPSSASPESPRKLKAMRRIGPACCGFASKHRAVPRRRRRRWAQPFEISFRICRSNSRRTG